MIRARRPQGELFADGAAVHHYATVTNRWDWNGERLLRWSHERCGTVEPAHDILKNELGGGVLPSYRFGANAAWWQLVVLTHNLVSALKRLALPEDWAPLRPRRLRFLLFHVAGRLVRHEQRLILRLARSHPGTAALVRARAQLFAPATLGITARRDPPGNPRGQGCLRDSCGRAFAPAPAGRSARGMLLKVLARRCRSPALRSVSGGESVTGNRSPVYRLDT